MLEYNAIKPHTYIVKDGEPYEVLSSHVFRKQQRKPVNQTKLKNLITGKVVEHSFHQTDKVEEADLAKRDVQYLYTNKGAWWFCDPENPSDRFEIAEDLIGERKMFLKEKQIIEGLVFDDAIIDIRLPIKMEFEVTEAPPNVKGNTASGANKVVVIETGASVTTPMFVETGDVIEVNTDTKEYVRRVEK